MLKKCAACLLVLALCVLCFGCGKQPGAPADGNSTTKAAADGKQTTAPAQTLAQGSKIAFLVGTGTQDPQFNPTALALAGGYDSSVMTVALPEDAIENPTNVVRTALATAEDDLFRNDARRAVRGAAGASKARGFDADRLRPRGGRGADRGIREPDPACGL